jgi:hypothetical protein
VCGLHPASQNLQNRGLQEILSGVRGLQVDEAMITPGVAHQMVIPTHCVSLWPRFAALAVCPFNRRKVKLIVKFWALSKSRVI